MQEMLYRGERAEGNEHFERTCNSRKLCRSRAPCLVRTAGSRSRPGPSRGQHVF